MRLRETFRTNEYGIKACMWCQISAAKCVIDNPCDSRISFEEELRISFEEKLRIPHGDGCGCYWCLPVRPGVSAPPSSEAVKRMDLAAGTPQ